MSSLVLGQFFKSGNNHERFERVHTFLATNDVDGLSSEMRTFCEGNRSLEESLLEIVPEALHSQVGLADGSWIGNLFGRESRFYGAVAGTLDDVRELESIQQEFANQRKYAEAARVDRRLRAVLDDRTLNFLSRTAILPKYGFPVDTVELEVKGEYSSRRDISLQRDLSQAVAEYAPGSQVVANKKVWESGGVKLVQGQEPVTRYYRYDEEGNFEHSLNKDEIRGRGVRQYFTPQWGFATDLNYRTREPIRKAERLYTTRPFFGGFAEVAEPVSKIFGGVSITLAAPGSLFILSEGHQQRQFRVCLSCGRHSAKRIAKHRTLYGKPCGERMGRYSYGYELVTDVVRIMFPYLDDVDAAYSLGYSLALGSSDALGVPQNDLNVALSRVEAPSGFGMISLILYDDVPGGAGFVARLSREEIFAEALYRARERVAGGCGCDSSCYGCLRSYRNQFVHSVLDRYKALRFIEAVTKVLTVV